MWHNQFNFALYFLIIIKYQPMKEVISEQKCQKCENQFDNSLTKIIICQQNHFVCQNCADQLSRQNSMCPECNCALQINNPYQNNIMSSFNISSRRWQPAGQQPFFNRSHPYSHYYNKQINQDFQLINRGFALGSKRSCSSRKFCTLMVFFLIVSLVLLVVRFRMSKCEIWGYKTCDYGYQFNYCCPKTQDVCPAHENRWDHCTYLLNIQNKPYMNGITVLAAIFGGFTVICSLLGYGIRKIEKNVSTNTYSRV